MKACDVLLAAAVAASLFARSAVARADCNLEDGGCAFNQYCGLTDGGPSDAGNTGASCLAQPCVLSSDCEDSGILCDTSRTIFQCVDCISTADCSGDLVCDPTTRTCVNPPPAPDAGEEGGAAEDAASPTDAGAARDATLPPSPDAGGQDASVPTFDSGEPAAPGEDAGASPGSLNGGACDCDVARPKVGLGAFALPLGVGLLFAIRRRRRV